MATGERWLSIALRAAPILLFLWMVRPLFGVVALGAMIAANVFVFGGAGYVIVVAPIGWIASAAYRHHLLTTRLANAG